MPNMPTDTEKAHRHKMPLPKVMSVAEFHEQFGTEQACLARLRELRWGVGLERFVCPACRHARGWWLPGAGRGNGARSGQ